MEISEEILAQLVLCLPRCDRCERRDATYEYDDDGYTYITCEKCENGCYGIGRELPYAAAVRAIKQALEAGNKRNNRGIEC